MVKITFYDIVNVFTVAWCIHPKSIKTSPLDVHQILREEKKFGLNEITYYYII